jgi:hypothetical protein
MAVDTLAPPPSSNVTVVPAAPSKGIKMGGEIHIGGGSTPTEPAAPAKPGTAKEALSQRLQKAAGPTPTAPAPPSTKPNEPAKPNPETPVSPETPDQPETPAAAATVDPKKKVSPWKVADEYKEKATKAELRAIAAEKELEAIRQGSYPKEVTERLTKAEARAKELEDEIRFVSYEKSPEFKEKFHDPYVKSWENRTGRTNGLRS